MPVIKGRLRPEDDLRIRANYSSILENVDTSYIIDRLISDFVFDTNDMHEIKAENTPRARDEKFLGILLRAGEKAYESFLSALESGGFKKMAKQIRETDISAEQRKDPFQWISTLPESVQNQRMTDQIASRLSAALGTGWEHVFLELDLPQSTIDQCKMNNTLSVTTAITNLFIRWKQREASNATLIRVLDALTQVDNKCTIDWDAIKKVLN